MKDNLLSRITFNIEQNNGKPCIRHMRIRVSDILSLMANGLSSIEILEEMPDLEIEDIQACLLFAISRIDHPILKAA